MAGLPTPEQLKPTAHDKLTLEAWSQGFMIGALIIMLGITLANMRKGVLLHKLIFIELILAVPNGFFIFFEPPVYGWFLSSTVILLLASWTLHNVIAWMKSKPFLGRRGNLIYIGSVILVQPYWILEVYANFAFFNTPNSRLFVTTRPFEAVFRDPWWIFTIVNLFWNIKFRYELDFATVVRVSPRFGVLLFCMILSLIFIVVDLLSVTPVINIGVINPFWKFAFIFKCFTDSIILDDFKASLDRLSQHRLAQILPFNIMGSTSCEHEFRHKAGAYKAVWLSGGQLQSDSSQVNNTLSRTKEIELLDDGDLSYPPPIVVRHIEDRT
ncbi:hypothetical protein EV126DRAFT_411716 [Verticillium dahliae]|nr:hypothetical protein EV126DRAFT_411716 [Verticillium dahliae]